jgi:protein phosphatase 1L
MYDKMFNGCFVEKGIKMNKQLALLFVCAATPWSYAMENNQLVREKKVGIFSVKNQRDCQEDFSFHGSTIDGGKLCAVYDGHGGHEVAEFLANNFHDYFSKTSGPVQQRMAEAFKNADNDEFVKLNKKAGSTASVVFIKDNIAHIAHVGDSRVVLEKDGAVGFATSDHKPNRADEYVRIEDAKGIVFNKRVNGFLAVSRAFGNYGIDDSKKIIISEPEYAERSLTPKNKFLVLATDGLWDVMNNEEVVNTLDIMSYGIKHLRVEDLDSFAKSLVLLAIQKKSSDNITVMVVDLLS